MSMRSDAKRVNSGNELNQYETRLRGISTQLQAIKTAIEGMKTIIDADADYTAADKTEILAGFNLVNNVKYTDFVTFINTVLP